VPSTPHLRTETDIVSETYSFVFLEYPAMDKVQKPSNPEYYIYTQSSEPFKMLGSHLFSEIPGMVVQNIIWEHSEEN
jgi:hypothetical protein